MSLWQVLLDWVPFVLIMSLMIVAIFAFGKRRQNAGIEVLREQIAQTKRTNDQLERIAIALEQRNKT